MGSTLFTQNKIAGDIKVGNVDAVTFAKGIISVCTEIKKVSHYDINIVDNTIVKIRIHLSNNNSFIDVFYNSHTSTIAYTLIENEKRIFGVDNTGGWHIHPFENPEEHIPSDKIGFANFVKMIP